MNLQSSDSMYLYQAKSRRLGRFRLFVFDGKSQKRGVICSRFPSRYQAASLWLRFLRLWTLKPDPYIFRLVLRALQIGRENPDLGNSLLGLIYMWLTDWMMLNWSRPRLKTSETQILWMTNSWNRLILPLIVSGRSGLELRSFLLKREWGKIRQILELDELLKSRWSETNHLKLKSYTWLNVMLEDPARFEEIVRFITMNRVFWQVGALFGFSKSEMPRVRKAIDAGGFLLKLDFIINVSKRNIYILRDRDIARTWAGELFEPSGIFRLERSIKCGRQVFQNLDGLGELEDFEVVSGLVETFIEPCWLEYVDCGWFKKTFHIPGMLMPWEIKNLIQNWEVLAPIDRLRRWAFPWETTLGQYSGARIYRVRFWFAPLYWLRFLIGDLDLGDVPLALWPLYLRYADPDRLPEAVRGYAPIVRDRRWVELSESVRAQALRNVGVFG